MNTGKAIETERLLLLPGQNARDNKPFLRMLREDGDFYMFCGVKYSRRRLRRFADYFERTGHGECIYSLFLRDEPERFIGYVGFHREDHYELEFYVSKPYRNRGYCTEASRAVIGQLFGEGLSVDGEMFIRSETAPSGLPVQVCCTKATDEEKQTIRRYIERFVKHFGNDTDELLSGTFFKLTPNSASPYRQLYVNN